MATETLNINGWDAGWPTGGLVNVDEPVASADGASVSTPNTSDVVIFDLDNVSSITDLDIVTGIDITVRCKKDAGGNEPPIPKMDVELLISSSSQGATNVTTLGNTFNNKFVSNAGWDSDWTQSQLNGAQVRVTDTTFELDGTHRIYIDCIDVVVTYTPILPIVEEPAKGSLAIVGKVPVADRTAHRTLIVGKGSLDLAGKIPSVRRADKVLPTVGAVALVGKFIATKRADKVLPSAAARSLNGKTNTYRVNFIPRPTVGATVLSGKTLAKTVAYLRPVTVVAATLVGKLPVADTTAHHVALPGRAQRILAPEAPLVPTTTNNFVGPSKGSTAIAGQAPTLDLTTSAWLDISASTVALAGQVPAVVQSQVRPVSNGAIALATTTPLRVPSTVVAIPAANVLFAGLVPSLGPYAASLILVGNSPTIILNQKLYPPINALVLQGQDVLANNAAVAPAAGEIAFTGQAPSLVFTSFIYPGTPGLLRLTADRNIEFIATPTDILVD